MSLIRIDITKKWPRELSIKTTNELVLSESGKGINEESAATYNANWLYKGLCSHFR